jgi:hypothetical protein
MPIFLALTMLFDHFFRLLLTLLIVATWLSSPTLPSASQKRRATEEVEWTYPIGTGRNLAQEKS